MDQDKTRSRTGESDSMHAGFASGHSQHSIDSLVEGLRHRSTIWNRSDDRRSRLILRPYGDGGISFSFVAFGVRIGVSLADVALLDELVGRIPADWQPIGFENLVNHYHVEWMDRSQGRDHAAQYLLYGEDGSDGRQCDREHLPDSFEAVLEDFISQYAEPWIFIHAGVVGWREKAILVPATSFSGKSTLVAALVARGATYYSDEFAVMDTEGLVSAFPRPISLRMGEHHQWRTRRIKLTETQHLAPSLPPLPVGLVALLSYDPDRAFWVERLDRGTAIMALCEHSVAIRRRPGDTFAALGAIVGRARVIRGFRGEADEAAAWLLTNADR